MPHKHVQLLHHIEFTLHRSSWSTASVGANSWWLLQKVRQWASPRAMYAPAMFYAINIRLPRNTTNLERLEYIDLVDAGISLQLYPTIPPNINYFRTLPWRIYHGRFILYTRHEESACHNTTPWDRSHDPLLEATQQWGVAALPWCHQSKGLVEETDAINTINHCESTKESKEWLNHVYTPILN